MSENLHISDYYLTFNLNKESFALRIHDVLEVLLDYRIVNVPDAPIYISGMLNFRGDIIPVICLKKKFKFPENDNKDLLIIVIEIKKENKKLKFGAIVDKVSEVIEIPTKDITNIPAFGSIYNPEYINGVIHRNEEYYMFLNIEKVFSDKEFVIIKNTEN